MIFAGTEYFFLQPLKINLEFSKPPSRNGEFENMKGNFVTKKPDTVFAYVIFSVAVLMLPLNVGK